MGKIGAFFRLTRIEHSIMLVIAVVAAELICGSIALNVAFVASLITPILVSMGSFAINDYFDVDADRANGFKKRPLVSGEISTKEALYWAVGLLVVGALFSLLINIYAFVIAVVFAALAYLYSYRLKDILLVGNVYIAFSMVIPFIYGDFVVSNSLKAIIVLVSVVIFLSGLAREIHGMIRDREGDSKHRGSKNMLHYVSPWWAGIISFILYLEAIAISIYVFVIDYAPFYHNLVYLVLIGIADIMLLYVAIGEITIGEDKKRFHKLARNLSLAAMAIALIAYLVSALIYINI